MYWYTLYKIWYLIRSISVQFSADNDDISHWNFDRFSSYRFSSAPVSYIGQMRHIDSGKLHKLDRFRSYIDSDIGRYGLISVIDIWLNSILSVSVIGYYFSIILTTSVENYWYSQKRPKYTPINPISVVINKTDIGFIGVFFGRFWLYQ